jgi:hypothetical protein
MKKCSNCGAPNSNSEIFCDYCSHELPKIKEFSIKEFLDDNYRLFTILGVFGALSYYLSHLPQNAAEGTVSSLAANVTTPSTIANPSWIPPSILLEFGTLLSYLVFVGVLGILIIETFKYEKNIQRSLFLYCLFFLVCIVILYSISVLTMIIPYFILISVIYFCGLLFSSIYNYIVKKNDNKVISGKVSLSVGGIILISLILSVLITLYLSSITSQNPSLVQQQDILFIIWVAFLLGLIIGIFFVGSSIVMIRYTIDLIKYGQTIMKTCLIALLFFFVGGVLWWSNIMSLGQFWFVMVFYGLVILLSLGLDYIKVKYALKF